MPNLGPTELVLLLFVVMIVFGAGKLPEVGGAIGKGIREFRKAQTELEDPNPPKEGSQGTKA